MNWDQPQDAQGSPETPKLLHHEVPADLPSPPAAGGGGADPAGPAHPAPRAPSRHHRAPRPRPELRQRHGKAHPAPPAAPLPPPLPLPAEPPRQVPGAGAVPGAAGGLGPGRPGGPGRRQAHLGQRERRARAQRAAPLPAGAAPRVPRRAQPRAEGGGPAARGPAAAGFPGHLQQPDAQDADGAGVGEPLLPQRHLRDEGRQRRLPQPGVPGAAAEASQEGFPDGLRVQADGPAEGQSLQVVCAAGGLPQRHVPALLRRARLRALGGPGPQGLWGGADPAPHQHGGRLRGGLPARPGGVCHRSAPGGLHHVPAGLRQVPLLAAGDGASLRPPGAAPPVAALPGRARPVSLGGLRVPPERVTRACHPSVSPANVAFC